MTSVAYVRVSSRAQTAAMQRHAIEARARARGDTIGRWVEEKRSARTLDRPALAKLRVELAPGMTLYVYRLDRLARSGIRDTLRVVDELRARGVELITVADGIELTGPTADIVIAVMAWAAEMERSAIGERISSARERLAAAGRAWGRPPSTSAALVARMRRLRAEGRTIRGIAIAVKVPRSRVARELAREPRPEKVPALAPAPLRAGKRAQRGTPPHVR